MAFVPKDWRNYPDTSTPLTAEALEEMEIRLAAAIGEVSGGEASKATPINGGTTVTVTTSSTPLWDANSSRVWVEVSNGSITATLYISLGVAAVVGEGIVLPPLHSRRIENYTGAGFGIATASLAAAIADL